MKKSTLVVVGLVTLFSRCDSSESSLAPGGGPTEMKVVLNVPLIKQQTNQWCWAACVEMVMHYYNKSTTSQCVQANKKFPGSNCCKSPTPQVCIKPAWPDYASYNFNYFTTQMGHALSWEQLKHEIDGKRPVSFSWGWTNGGGHIMNAIGYIESGSDKFVAVNDPRYPSSIIMTYDEYVSSNRYVHWADYYKINPKQ